ncbi:ComF family protein [Leptolyngbya sp. FACHB-261]|uniref:ComF family protein n=1 Tax=Leptolyngbya sp. FACHB-261 TaxID=2692806 RepID=UPI0016876F7D|nr:ComF family protein [Leptolyngbya sp. FACHB-261]MBD2103472.1 ComF family protein [Leptolyngbya sp. FACHB-261]
MKKYLHQLWQGCLGTVLQPECSLCQRPATATGWCSNCLTALQHCRFSTVDQMQVVEPPPAGLAEGMVLDSLSVFAWGHYGGALKRSLTTLKYQQKPHLALALGFWLGQSWHSQLLLEQPLRSRAPIVVPIPLSQEKLKLRGFNQAERLAQGFCRWTGLRLHPQALQRVRNTEAQFRLSAAERAANLSRAFAVGNVSPGTAVLLLDDIYTTGATVWAAVEAFAQRGIPTVGVVVMARPTSAPSYTNAKPNATMS